MERNAMQMVEVLMARLKNLEGKVVERQRAAGEDRNPDSGLCSSLVSALVADLSDDEDDGEKSSHKYSVFRPKPTARGSVATPGSRGSMRGNAGSSPSRPGSVSPQAEVYVTFRSEPSTEFGKRLEHKFEVELLGSHGAPPGSSSGGLGSGGLLGAPATPGRAVTFGAQPPALQTNLFAGAGAGAGGGGLTVEVGTPPAGVRRTSRVGTRERTQQKKADEKKAKRSAYEKRLQDNLESFVTRSVTDQVYQMPVAAKRVAGGLAGTAPFTRPPGGATVPRTALGGDNDCEESLTGLGRSGGGANSADRSEKEYTFDGSLWPRVVDESSLDCETWPLPVSPSELNPKLLLSLACARVSLPSGESIFKHFVLGQRSCWLFIYLYWFCHCKFFQPHSEREQEHLLRRLGAIYVQLLGNPAFGKHKDFFFSYYPYVLGNAIAAAFHYLCPGSRHLYSHTFRRILYLQCVQVIGGHRDVTPIAILEMRDGLFPDEAAEELSFSLKEAAKRQAALLKDQDTHSNLGPGGGGSRPGSAKGGPKLVPLPISDDLPPLPSSLSKSGGGGGKGGGNGEGEGEAGVGVSFDNGGGLSPVLGGGSGAAGGGGVQGGAVLVLDTGGDSALIAGRQSRRKVTIGGTIGGGRATTPEHGLGASLVGDDLHTALARMELIWRSQRLKALAPLQGLAGSRDTLRFRPAIPAEVTALLPRQKKLGFDTVGISPLVQQYLEHPEPFIAGGRRPEKMGRTDPVRWCETGGSETHRRQPSRKEHHESIAQEHRKAVGAFKEEEARKQKELILELRSLEKQRKSVYRGGAVAKGRYSLELVAEIAGRSNEGARKRMEKAKQKEREREASERERQAKALAAQKSSSIT